MEARKNLQVSCASLQSDKQSGLPGHLEAVWCSDCSNSCCKMISSGRTLSVTLLIPATEPAAGTRHRTESSKGCRWGDKDRASGSLEHGNVSSCFGPAVLKWFNLQTGVLTNWCSSKQFSFFPILNKLSHGFHPRVDL